MGAEDKRREIRHEDTEGGRDLIEVTAGRGNERAEATSTAAGTAVSDKTTTPENQPASPAPPRKRKIFHGLQMYINGSTAPLVSDHRLKQLLVQHGAGICISLARRTVTHVILGTPNGGEGGGGGGAGGGLSARKMQKEIKRVRGCGVKYVGVEWYVFFFLFVFLRLFFPVYENAGLSACLYSSYNSKTFSSTGR